MTQPLKYRTPPKRVFRALGLGVAAAGSIRVIAGFRFRWWSPFGGVDPIIVNARILKIHPPAEGPKR